jgi:hypothetical protein
LVSYETLHFVFHDTGVSMVTETKACKGGGEWGGSDFQSGFAAGHSGMMLYQIGSLRVW